LLELAYGDVGVVEPEKAVEQVEDENEESWNEDRGDEGEGEQVQSLA
jgi:hypothetical protein